MTRTARSVAIAAAFLALGATAASAQDKAMEDKYAMMQGAIAAAQACKGVKIDRKQHEMLSDRIEADMKGALGAGKRLTIIEKQKSTVAKAVEMNGCKDQEVAKMVLFYDVNFAPLMKK